MALVLEHYNILIVNASDSYRSAKRSADINGGHRSVPNIILMLSISSEVCQMLSLPTKTTKSNEEKNSKHTDRFSMTA